jgi:peptide/bleomycin uptake transporter
VAHAAFKAVVKSLLNTWYGSFYDLVQSAATDLVDVGSGEGAECVNCEEGRAAVNEMLVRFVAIVAPGLVVHPLAKYLVSVWTYHWRVSLIRAYLDRWNPLTLPVEGAAQRVHEDTLRFVDGIYSCVATVLDSALTLVVFIPVLLELGAQVAPPWSADTVDGWLVLVAVAGAVGGLGVSAFVGRHLVTLEVQNQRIEAQLRTRLVLLAETPDAVLGRPATAEEGRAERAEEHPDDAATPWPALQRRSSSPISPSPIPIAPTDAFAGVLYALWTNYARLFCRFIYMNVWLGLFDQTFVLAPYVLCAPLLFADDPARRITLGTLVQVSNAFGRVFDSLAVVSESWTAVNAWRSVLRRLREFENQLYGGRGFRGSLLARTAAAAVELPLEPAAHPGRPPPHNRRRLARTGRGPRWRRHRRGPIGRAARQGRAARARVCRACPPQSVLAK